MKLNRKQRRKALKADIEIQRTIDLTNQVTGSTVQAIVTFAPDLTPTLSFIEDNKNIIFTVPAVKFAITVMNQVDEAFERLKDVANAKL